MSIHQSVFCGLNSGFRRQYEPLPGKRIGNLTSEELFDVILNQVHSVVKVCNVGLCSICCCKLCDNSFIVAKQKYPRRGGEGFLDGRAGRNPRRWPGRNETFF